MNALRSALFALSIIPVSLFAKGDMVRIEIRGANLGMPIEITDARVKEFTPWAGPGVTINGIKQTEGFIIDWPHGAIADRPKGLPHYEVSFYAKLHEEPNGAKEQGVHVVLYDYDLVTERGYVYLPGKGEEWYPLNASKMVHDFLEGNWFRASHAWDNFVGPIIANTKEQILERRASTPGFS
jgi:hypothetical protein